MISSTFTYADTATQVASESRPMSTSLGDTGYGVKPIVPALGIMIGTAEQGAHRATTVILDGPFCPFALQFSGGADEARDLAASLIAAAVELEKAAADLADAALTKAKGK